MVPILQEKLPAERVTLWSPSESTPFRAIWLENSSKLTLDRGSFSIFESGVFAGQGLLDPIHPGEKRLLSYAADQAIHVRPRPEESKRALRQVKISPRGQFIKRYAAESRTTYIASNSAEEPRVVVIEVPRQANRTLSPDSKAAETAATLYRFRLPVPSHQSASVLVADEGLDTENYYLDPEADQTPILQRTAEEAPELSDKLKPIIDAEKAVAVMRTQLNDLGKNRETLTTEEARSRENLTALKGNDGSKRFVDELNRTEDQLESNRQQTEAFQAKLKAAVESLRQTLQTFSADWQTPNWQAPPK